MIGVLFYPDAERELDESIGFYESCEPGLGLDFEREVLDGIFHIHETPGRFPSHIYDTRKYLLDRFPFHLIYLQAPETIWIVAVAHCSRKPDYWIERVGSTQ